jgi:hypothetical protein
VLKKDKNLFVNSKLIKSAVLICLSLSFAWGKPLFSVVAIGNSADSGHSYNSSGFYLSGWGEGLSGGNDNFLFAYGNPQGDFDIQVHCSHIADTSNRSEAGIMVRSDTTSGAMFCALEILQEHGIAIRYRSLTGADVRTIDISPVLFDKLRIKRTGNRFDFYYRSSSDSVWIHFPTAFTFSFPDMIPAGLMLSSNSTAGIAGSQFDTIRGLPEEQIVPGNSCTPVVYDFNNGISLDTLGFRSIRYWGLDTGKNIRTTLSPDSVSYSSILTPPVSMNFDRDTNSISWDLRIDGDTAPRFDDYSLFSVEKMVLNDRAKITGLKIGSASGIETGIDDTINSEIRARDTIFFRDRTIVNGNVLTSSICNLGFDVSIRGTTTQHASLTFPSIPVRTVDTGTTSITVNPGDSIDLAPGNYRVFQVYSNARVRFRPGKYSFARLFMDTNVKWYLNADSTKRIDINIKDTIRLGDRDSMKIGDSTASRNITVYTNQSGTVYLGTDLSLFGSFILPHAEAHLNSRTTAINGGIYARKITMEPDVRVIVNTPSSVLKRLNSLTVSLLPSDSTKHVYSFQMLIHRGMDQDTLRDFIFKCDSTIIKSASSRAPTILKRQMNFRLIMSPVDSVVLVRLLYNNGNGPFIMMDSVPFTMKSVSALKFRYDQRSPSEYYVNHVDNIMFSCDNGDTCGHIYIVKDPSDTTVCSGESVRFSCSVEATGKAPVYQWYKNGSPVAWTNNSEYKINGVSIVDSGSSFYCRITGDCNRSITTSTAILRIAESSAPEITIEHDSVSVPLGGAATFRVWVQQGTGLQYQWKRNNKNITGATNSVYVLNNVQSFNNFDQYTVAVTNSCGKMTLSSPVKLIVTGLEPCNFTVHPVSDTLLDGEYYRTDVKAICSNVSYSWYKDGIEIPGRTGNTLIYGPLRLTDNGSEIFCIAHNSMHNDTSESAYITVKQLRDGGSSVAISGELYDGAGRSQGNEKQDFFDFQIKLYTVKTGGAALYTENFKDGHAVPVFNGQFTVTLGKGNANGDLQRIVSSYKELYAEVYAGKNGSFELAAPRLCLTAAPYAFTSGIKIIYGDGSPNTSSVEAPLGTMYIDRADNNRTWKLGKNGWVRLD